MGSEEEQDRCGRHATILEPQQNELCRVPRINCRLGQTGGPRSFSWIGKTT